MNIFVGNLSFNATEADAKKLFEGFGNVASAVIVMEKEKKAPKSRGFGFVQMPDEQQALAAIAALNGKEFMGRVINVNPTCPKTKAERKSELKKKMQLKVKVEVEQYLQEGREQKKVWINPVFNKPGTYKGGRRTQSHMKRHGLAGMQKEAKPWRKTESGIKPCKKPAGDAKPRSKSNGRPRKIQV